MNIYMITEYINKLKKEDIIEKFSSIGEYAK